MIEIKDRLVEKLDTNNLNINDLKDLHYTEIFKLHRLFNFTTSAYSKIYSATVIFFTEENATGDDYAEELYNIKNTYNLSKKLFETMKMVARLRVQHLINRWLA